MDNNEDVKKKGAFFSCGNYGSLSLSGMFSVQVNTGPH